MIARAIVWAAATSLLFACGTRTEPSLGATDAGVRDARRDAGSAIRSDAGAEPRTDAGPAAPRCEIAWAACGSISGPVRLFDGPLSSVTWTGTTVLVTGSEEIVGLTPDGVERHRDEGAWVGSNVAAWNARTQRGAVVGQRNVQWLDRDGRPRGAAQPIDLGAPPMSGMALTALGEGFAFLTGRGASTTTGATFPLRYARLGADPAPVALRALADEGPYHPAQFVQDGATVWAVTATWLGELRWFHLDATGAPSLAGTRTGVRVGRVDGAVRVGGRLLALVGFNSVAEETGSLAVWDLDAGASRVLDRGDFGRGRMTRVGEALLVAVSPYRQAPTMVALDPLTLAPIATPIPVASSALDPLAPFALAVGLVATERGFAVGWTQPDPGVGPVSFIELYDCCL